MPRKGRIFPGTNYDSCSNLCDKFLQKLTKTNHAVPLQTGPERANTTVRAPDSAGHAVLFAEKFVM